MDANQKTTQAIVSSRAKVVPHKKIENFALFDEDLNPIDLHPQTSANLPIEVITIGTAVGTAAKTTSHKVPTANTMLALKFTNGNSVAAPTVAFNGGSAKPVLLGGAAPAAGEITVAADGIAFFMYDGTSLHQFGVYS